MARFRYLFVVLLALGLSACGSNEDSELGAQRERLSGDSELVVWFGEAEAESGVPAELLATLAWVQSGMSMKANELDSEAHAEHGHVPREWGLMAIGTGGLTTLEQAADVVALSPAEVASDPRSNIRAAALLLAKTARSANSDWSPALVAYGGEALSSAVVRLMATGWRTVDDSGRSIALRASGAQQGDGIGTVQQALGYPGAIWSAAYSGNYTAASRGAATIDYVVIHTTQGSYAGAISWFKNPSSNVSAHYVVRSSDGQITQMVDDSDIAWHDACFNTPSIGIEHEGYVEQPAKWYTEAMYKSSAKLTAWLCDKYGIPKDRQHIMGHGETPDCSTHTDPGSGWNWTHYMDLVKNGGISDKDGDGVGDGSDNCPGVKNAGQLDTDKDGKGDACDGDDDGDGIGDANDNCPKVKNSGQLDSDKDGKGNACDADDDGDGIADTTDNCPIVINKGQLDTDKDGKGDACDADDDGDGVGDANDNCPKLKNAGQADSDGDGKGDACEADNDDDGIVDVDDNCANTSNADQLDTDSDGKGDACDGDDDGDGVLDGDDNCPLIANSDQANSNSSPNGDACDDDQDVDGISDAEDICPSVGDPAQTDSDEDGQGDACDDDDDGDGVLDSEDQCPLAAPGSAEASAASGLGCDPDPTQSDADDPVEPDPPEAPPGVGGETVEASGCTTAGSAPRAGAWSALLGLLAAAACARRARRHQR